MQVMQYATDLLFVVNCGNFLNKTDGKLPVAGIAGNLKTAAVVILSDYWEITAEFVTKFYLIV